MSEQPGGQIRYADPLLSGDRRLVILSVGQQKGLWTFLAQHEGSYLVEQDGHTVFLTPSEVDRLPFDFFVNDGVVRLPSTS